MLTFWYEPHEQIRTLDSDVQFFSLSLLGTFVICPLRFNSLQLSEFKFFKTL
jgi:hypothetical protein